jgi:hypothetical protein
VVVVHPYQVEAGLSTSDISVPISTTTSTTASRLLNSRAPSYQIYEEKWKVTEYQFDLVQYRDAEPNGYRY